MTRLTKTLIIGLSATTLIAGSIISGLADDRGGKRDGRMGMGQMLQQLDADSDNAVTSIEMANFINAKFQEADTNADGVVTAQEMATLMPGRRSERMAERLLTRIDMDENGTVSLNEVNSRSQKLFALADIDESGTIEEDEMPRRGKRKR